MFRNIFHTKKLPDKLFNPVLIIIFLIIVSAVPRFPGLGFSHFYGDEAKTLYLDKTVPAGDFFLSQRKGPVQFLVVWAVEKLSGGFSEGLVRLPFAVAGTLSVVFFYLYVAKIYGSRTAFIASLLYSLSGFNVAFSRTAQYQSFLMLFGFSFLYFFEKFASEGKKPYLLLSAVLLALALLTHYDSVFFLLPLILNHLQKFREDKKFRSSVALYFIIPVVLLCAFFYVPYVIKGNFSVDTLNYLSKRMLGKEFLPNNSLYTISIYNPLSPLLFLLAVGLLFGLFSQASQARKLFLWFFPVFILFEFIFQNPGTHILNYLLPLYILSAMFLSKLVDKWRYSSILIGIFAGFMYFVALYVYVPSLNLDYPWRSESKVGFLIFHRPVNRYQLFLYGFPYNVGWNKIQNYMYSQKGVRGYFTNDNDSLGAYYLLKIPLTGPGSNFLPQYYIHILNPQELQDRSGFLIANSAYYTKVHEIYNGSEKTAEIYKLTKSPFNNPANSPNNN